MASPGDLGHDEHELLARLALAYYEDGLTQEALGHRFGLSRPKVQRLLERARASGVVEIRVSTPPWLHVDLERTIQERFDLDEVIVVPSRPEPQARREEVARAAARHLERTLRADSVVAVGHGRDAAEVPRFFAPRGRIPATFVSAMGGSPLAEAPTNPNEIVRRLADRCGGRVVGLYAPAYVESARMRDRLLRQPAVAESLRIAASATVALVGVGGTDDDCTMVRSGCFSLEELRRLRSAGAVGDVLGNYVDIDGDLLHSPETERLVALTLDELKGVDSVVVAVSEREKPVAILGVLRTGAVDVLVLDEDNAQILLELESASRRRPETEV
jgi:DNA-binding transcriptional regulator LsrR (DeoR family)